MGVHRRLADLEFATKPWTEGQLDFDSPEADMIVVPATGPLTAWQGSRDQFELSGSCPSSSPIDIRATIVTTVYADGCDTGGSGVAVSSYAEAIQQFAAQRGHTTIEVPGVGPTIGGFPATMFAIDFDTAACGGIDLWNGVGIGDGSAWAYFLDVDGVALGILLRFPNDASMTVDQRQSTATMTIASRFQPRAAPTTCSTSGLGPEVRPGKMPSSFWSIRAVSTLSGSATGTPHRKRHRRSSPRPKRSWLDPDQ